MAANQRACQKRCNDGCERDSKAGMLASDERMYQGRKQNARRHALYAWSNRKRRK